MHSVSSTDGVAISYRSFGGGPLTVMLVHGWMTSGAAFDDLVDALGVSKEDPRLVLTRDRLRLVIPDLRGTGRSDKPETGYTIAQYADDVLAVADAVRAESFVVVGHSMGGQIAQWLAATSPARVRGAALLCPVPAGGMALPEDVQALFRGSGQNRAVQETILRTATRMLSGAALERLLDDAAKIPVPCIQQSFDAWTAGGFADKLADIRAPSLVVATDEPFLTPDLLRSEIVARIARSDLAYLPGAGHYVQVERPLETAALIRSFLLGIEG